MPLTVQAVTWCWHVPLPFVVLLDPGLSLICHMNVKWPLPVSVPLLFVHLGSDCVAPRSVLINALIEARDNQKHKSWQG